METFGSLIRPFWKSVMGTLLLHLRVVSCKSEQQQPALDMLMC